jgi:hypothetical protein
MPPLPDNSLGNLADGLVSGYASISSITHTIFPSLVVLLVAVAVSVPGVTEADEGGAVLPGIVSNLKSKQGNE